MGNPFEAVWNTLKVTVDNANEPKHPLHVIEVGDCWKYLTMVEEFIRYEEIGLHTTNDDEVHELLIDIKKLCEEQSQKLRKFMINEGIPLPDVTPVKPESQEKEIPMGVKLTDDEIVNGMSLKLILSMQHAAKGQADAVRNDLGMMWLEFFSQWVTAGNTLKTLSRKTY
ncbi:MULTISPECIES: DUF3231 family protein [Bacillaceae]|uniref:DUF3231 family protein n=1 Tax=Evansella alkalicola TaxID=745819 RepID=A0ABS6JVW0_9BACI|nr:MULTISPECIES: DUF3231 family protein [Bacillaceae]MBU9722628.1 DUF3231 family protein [Bacillus alkalicola]